MDTIIARHITNHINSYISPTQHGFIKNRSTTTNLLTFWNTVTTNIENNKQTDTLILDFAKAFDKINHVLLLHKLQYFVFTKEIISWFHSYFYNRKQLVKYNNYQSNIRTITSGVFQGSSLGPILFNIFINDLLILLTHKYQEILTLAYADDIKLTYTPTTYQQNNQLQNALEDILIWSDIWKLPINFSKTNIISFHRKQTPLTPTYYSDGRQLAVLTSIKDLGIVFNSNCTFTLHYINIIKETLKLLGYLRRLSINFQNNKIIIILYNTIIKPKLSYCNAIWFSHI